MATIKKYDLVPQGKEWEVQLRSIGKQDMISHSIESHRWKSF
jgi:hypothetical protein